MFRNWGFLLGEIWVLLLLAALLGLFVGWLIWGRAMAALRGDLDACRNKCAGHDAELARLKTAANDAEDKANRAAADIQAAKDAEARAKQAAKDADAKRREAAAAAKAAAVASPVVAAPKPAAKKASPSKPSRPKALKAARGGKADDLKLIKGIGPQMEQLCNKLGFFHFDQIAAWTKSELAWVDDNLEGFKGRAGRDEWVKQAKILAKGGSTEFSRRN